MVVLKRKKQEQDKENNTWWKTKFKTVTQLRSADPAKHKSPTQTAPE